MCGVYGALHNQISHTVSPSFFDFDLFLRFDTPELLRNRLGASVVGWQASWWMGLLLGPPIVLVGLIIPGRRTYFARCLFAFGLVVSTTLIVGMAGLYYANTNVPAEQTMERAGIMHDSSYLGGFLGIITGSAFLVGERLRMSWATQRRIEAQLASNSEREQVV